MYPELVVLYIVAGAFTAALAGLTMPTGQSSFPATFISMSICLLWPLFLWPVLSVFGEASRRLRARPVEGHVRRGAVGHTERDRRRRSTIQ
jgi:hypothetical protein